MSRIPEKADTTLTQLTLRGFDSALEKRLREVARERDLSLNRAALFLLRRGAGLTDAEPAPVAEVGAALDRFVGLWSPEEERELLDATAAFDEVDESLWG